MSTTSKSPRKVLLTAYVTAQEQLPEYAHRFAPKKYTQHQLIAYLVLKVHQKKDYRGIVELLQDNPDLCVSSALRRFPITPHCKRHALVCLNLIKSISCMATRSSSIPKADLDPPCQPLFHLAFPSNQRSEKASKQVSFRKFGKLMILICRATHMILDANATAGPTPDVAELAPLLERLPTSGAWVVIERLVADAGFDSAFNHQLLREEHGIKSVIPTMHGRPFEARAITCGQI